jgi:hypothetical protein
MIIKRILILFVLVYGTISAYSQMQKNDSVLSLQLPEIIVHQQYPFKNKSEQKKYELLKSDLQTLYPLIVLVRNEYVRINKEMELYEGKRKKQFLKWYETYAKEKYMPYLANLNYRQGRLFIKMISRELDTMPYQIIKEYLNGFKAVFWQLTSHLFLANLRVEYNPAQNPMIEHIMKELDANYSEKI